MGAAGFSGFSGVSGLGRLLVMRNLRMVSVSRSGGRVRTRRRFRFCASGLFGISSPALIGGAIGVGGVSLLVLALPGIPISGVAIARPRGGIVLRCFNLGTLLRS